MLVLCLLLALPATAQRYGKNKVQRRGLEWQVLTTPHFDLHFHDGADEIAVRAAVIAERTYREYADRLDRDLPFRVPFILYSSHAEFAQTNVAEFLIGEGTGGFTEPFRNRVVLPYNGSHEEFVHVIRHELVHVFMFDMAFGARSADLGRNAFFSIPLWFAEGVAEWLSSGWDAHADMVMRDATINDYLAPLSYVGGYMVYKQGQAAMRLLSDRYGPKKLNEFWRQVGRSRSVERALVRTYGLRMKEFEKLYAREQRCRYWPGFSHLEQLDQVARPLTGVEDDRAAFHGRPALNPDGDLVVCFTNRDGVIDLYLLSALDGREIRRLGRSMRASRFESFHSFRSGLSWSPNGLEVVLVAKSGNRETLHTIRVSDGKVTRSWELGLDVAANPAWSPDGSLIALVGTRRGRTELYVLEVEAGALERQSVHGVEPPFLLPGGNRMLRLTSDVGDEGAPAWSPDGRRLAFSFNPQAEIEFEFELLPGGGKKLHWASTLADSSRIAPPPAVDLLGLDGARSRLFDADILQRDPVWVDATTLAVVDGEDGIDNLSLVTLDSTGTRVAGRRRLTNVLGGLQHLSYAPRSDRLVFSAFHAGGYDLYAADQFMASWSDRQPNGEDPGPVVLAPPSLVTRAGPPDTVRIDPERIGLVSDYSARFHVDASRAGAGGAVYYTNAGGLGFANMITLTDHLGDRRLDFLVNFYGDVDNSDLAASYTFLKHRVDLSGGAFLFNNFYNSVLTSVGELLTEDTLFKEKNYGLYARAAYPLTTFDRLELDLQYLTSERTVYGVDDDGFLVPTEERHNRLVQPTVSMVHDNALYGLHGPMAGSRWSVSAARALPIGSKSLDRWNAVADLRKYVPLSRRTSLALHATFAQSGGEDPRSFLIGGPWTLRGYRYYDFQSVPHLVGTKLALAQIEYRIPFIDYLVFGWPGRWGLSGVGGAVFFDAGVAWDDDVRLMSDGRFHDVRADVGLGLRANMFFLPVKFDWAWRTDLGDVAGNVFHFSIGPDF